MGRGWQGKGRAGQWPRCFRILWGEDVTAERVTRAGGTHRGRQRLCVPCQGWEQLEQPMANRLPRQGHSVGHSLSLNSFQGVLWNIFHPHRQKHGDPSWVRNVGAAAPQSPRPSPTLSPQCRGLCPALSYSGICRVPDSAQAFGISHPSKCPDPL